MRKILLVMTGGGLGALSRYFVNWFVAVSIGPGFDWATLFVNSAGCLLIGISFALAERTKLFGPSARLFFVTGFLGGLTTFSAYSGETVHFLREGSGVEALASVLANNAAGVFLAGLGLWLGTFVLKDSR